jgi:hypothetical protein
MLTQVLKLHLVQLIDDFCPHVIVLLITNYCQHFVCVNPNCYRSYLDVIVLHYFLYLEQPQIFTQKKYAKVTATIKINMRQW